MSLTSRNIVVTLSVSAAGFQNQMNAAANNVKTFNQNLSGIGGALGNYNTQVNKSAISTQQLNQATLPAVTATTNLGNAGTATTSRMDKLREVFAGNRGLIYSMGAIFGTITGVIFELQLMGDASQQVAQDTDKLNQLQAAGLEGTKEYSQAEAALAKDQRFLSFSTRNLSAAVANFVPELLMVTSMLSKGGGVMKIFSGNAGKLGSVMKALTGTTIATSAATTTFTGALANMNTVSGAGIGSLGGLKGAIVGLLGPIGLGVAAAIALEQGIMALQNRMDEAGLKFAKLQKGLLFSSPRERDEWWGKSEAQMKELTSKVGPKSALELMVFPDQIKQEYEAKGGKFDASTGEIATPGREAFKTQAEGWGPYVGTLIKAQQPLDKVIASMKKTGLTMQEINPVISAQQIAVGQTKDAYVEWGAAMNPANTIINKLKGDVMSGILPYDRLGEAIKTEMEKMQESGQVTESSASAVEYLASKHLNELVPGIGKSAKAAKAAAKDESEYTKMIDEANKTLATHLTESEELQGLQDRLNAAFGTSIDLKTEDYAMSTAMDEIIQKNNDAYKGEELALLDIASAHKILTPLMRSQITNYKDDVTAMTEDIASNIDWNKAQTDSVTNLKLVAQGHLAAVLSMEEFSNSLVSGKAALDFETSMLNSLADSFGIQLPMGIKVSNEQLKQIITTLKMGGNEMKIISDLIEDQLNKHLERFSDIIGSENFKDMGKAFKELDFGSIPKKVRGAFKDMFADMRQVSERGKEFGTAWDMVITSIITGTDKVSTGDRKKVFREMGDDLDRIAKIDPEAKGLNEAIIQPLLKLKGEKFDEAILKNANTIDMLNEAMANGDVSGAEYVSIIKENTLATSESTIPTGELQKKVQALVDEYKRTGDQDAFVKGMDALGVSAGGAVEPSNDLEAALYAVGGTASSVVTIAASMSKSLTDSVGTAFAFCISAAQQGNEGVVKQMGSMIAGVKPHVTSMNTYFGKTIPQAMGKSVDAADTLATDVPKNMSSMVAKVKPHITTMNTYFGKTLTGAFNSAKSAADALKRSIDALKSKEITVTTTYKYKTEGSPPKDAQKTGSSIHLENTDTADFGYLGTGGGSSSFQNTDSISGEGRGPYIFNLDIKGSELVPEQRMTRYIKKVSGSNLPNMT